MKKIALFFAAFLFSAGIASAQFLSFGIKGGLNFSTLKFDDIQNITSGSGTYSLQSDESFQGFHIGAMARVKLFSAYLQPELYINTAGGNVLVEEFQSGGGSTEYVRQIKYNKVDLPVLLGFKIGPARINAGPVASVILSENSEIEEIIPEFEAMSKTATIGFQAGVGIDILKMITLDYRFEGGLSRWGDEIEVGNNSYAFDSRANVHLISVGILF